MARLLRTLRNNLGVQHRLFRVLTSTLGEICMVMVGVLLALWVNNWNDDRKDRIKERKILREMNDNLASDLEDCRYNIGMNQRLLRGNTAVLKQLTERTPFHDSLRVHYGNILGNTTLSANIAAYDNLKSMGFNLVRNDSLRNMITTLYSQQYRYMHDVEMEVDGKVQLEEVLPMMHAKVVVDTMWASAWPIDPEALMDDASFKGMLRTNIFFRNWMIGRYKSLEKRIQALQAMIGRELVKGQGPVNPTGLTGG
ncbi:MAG: hypothetical protein JSS84_01355 [Bacteroidetes bacterium]|nr:hypothetical protein [Bacteroidota bacterium]